MIARTAIALPIVAAQLPEPVAADPTESDGFFNRAWYHERVFDNAAAVRDLDKAIADMQACNAFERSRVQHKLLFPPRGTARG